MRMYKETKDRLGILWVLLNVSTEVNNTDALVEVMNAIEKTHKDAPKMWNKSFRIMVGEKTVYEWPQQ